MIETDRSEGLPMLVTADDLTAFRFSTGDLPPGKRLAVYRGLFDRTVTKAVEVDTLSDEFACEVRFRVLSRLRVTQIATTPLRVRWRGSLLANRGEDHVGMVLFREGRASLSQCRQEAEIGAGGATVLSEDPVAMLRGASRYVFFSMPKAMLAPMIADADAAFMSPIPSDTEALRLLVGYADVLTNDTEAIAPELASVAETHVRDLVALAIGATRDAAEIATGRGLRAMRLRALKADIRKNISGDVTAAALAARHRVTPRYVHMLLESEGITLSRFVLRTRLARVHRMLADPQYDHFTIGAVAFEVGFNDLSTFNRAFRRHYGATPSDVRAAFQRNLQ
jgi:AraC-like DNA-binding protein